MVKNNKLISRAQSGDEQAFAELMRAYYAYVYAVVIKIVNNRHDAEEVVQDTFFNAYRGLPQLEDRTKFKGWLAKIARNRARNWRRSQKVDTVSIDEVGEHTLQVPDAVDDELIRAEQRELIRRAMETLPEKDREIARSYYLDGASYDELIQTHGLSYKAISFRLSRVKQKLAKRLSHLLTAIFVPPATTLKQIYSGGLFAMKIGTAPKITVGAIGIVALIFVGVHQIILPKFGASKNTVTSVQTEAPSEELAETDANQETEEGKTQHQISDQDMEQINNFFAQFDDAEAQSEAEAAPPSTESETELAITNTDAESEDTQAAKALMNSYLEACKNLDFEALLPLVTGTAKKNLEVASRILNIKPLTRDDIMNTLDNMPNLPEGVSEDIVDNAVQLMEKWIQSSSKESEIKESMREIMQEMGQAEIVSGEYVGDEFHFRLSLSERIGQLVRMQKVDGVWQIYRMDEYMEELN